MELLDCYRLLGLTPQASLAEVKTSYRRLARRLHPDLNPGLPHDPFVRLHHAYQVLLEAVPAQPVTPQGARPHNGPTGQYLNSSSLASPLNRLHRSAIIPNCLPSNVS